MHTRSIVGGMVLALVGAVSSGVLPAKGTHAGQGTHCLAEFDVTLTPGLSMTPNSGTFTTKGESGTMACNGPINGQQVTRTGSRGEEGRYGTDGPNSCNKLDGKGDVTFFLTLPTAGGPQHVEGPATLVYGPMQGGGLYGGSLQGRRMFGTFQITPTQGDCLTTPITEAHVKCDEWIVDEKDAG